MLATLITPDNTSIAKFQTILFSNKKIMEKKSRLNFFRVENFKRPKYPQCNIQFLSSCKAPSFLYKKNYSSDTREISNHDGDAEDNVD